jgi:excisionase family DNA binding protein
MTTEPADREVLTPAEAAAWLRVSSRTLRRYAAEGRIECVELSARTMRYPVASIEALLGGDQATGRDVPHNE